MAVASLKPKSSIVADDGAAEFSAARVAFLETKAEIERAQAAIEDLRTLAALRYAERNDSTVDKYVLKRMRDRISVAWPGGNVPKDHRIAQLRQDAEDVLEDKLPGLAAAQEAWTRAQRRRTAQIARMLIPRQRAAVAAIADALSLLSVAIGRAEEVNRELARTAPLSESPLLPNVLMELIVGSFADPKSQASQWRRRVRQLGLLD